MRTVIELWLRRREPESHDLIRAIRAANRLEAEPSTPPGVRALACRLIQDLHEAAGWDILPCAHLPRCEAASDEARTTSAAVVEAVQGALASVEGPVLLAGTLGAGRALFGAWDVLPKPSAELVLLSDTPEGSPTTTAGVPRTHAGPMASMLRQHSEPAELAGRPVLIPSPELAAARVAPQAETSAELDALIFCAAAHRAVVSQTWQKVLNLAAELGHGRAPEAAVVRLGLEEWLDLRVTRRARLASALRRVLWR